MLRRNQIEKQLKEKGEDFVGFVESQRLDLEEYLSSLNKISRLTSVEIIERISESENIGAIPSSEIDSLEEFALTFDISWSNHEEARVWAREILKNRTTFAADGSQYYSEKDTSLPVGAVQIGWFENPHDDSKSYEKDVDLRLLTPKDLLENQEEPLKPESRISEEMFSGEVEKIGDFLSGKQGWQERGERMPLAFFDRPMLLPFASAQSKLQRKFVKELIELIRHSRNTKVPLVGYVDRGFSRDLINLIDAFNGNKAIETRALYDSTLLSLKNSTGNNVLKNWGDRTPFCYSQRKGMSAFVDPTTEKSLVGFTFLQTTGSSAPARLDIPSWVFEEGLLDEVANTVRAECIVGVGYPYPIETADATAVISSRDRQIFLRALQEFAKKNNLNFSFSRKNTSKGRRR